MSPLPVTPSPDVSEALISRRPIVALESTVIAQGLPWPANLETASGAEEAVRVEGAMPATIAVIDGVIRLGLNDREREQIAATSAKRPNHPGRGSTSRPDPSGGDRPGLMSIAKANRRDLAAMVAAGRHATTTVSATLWIARRFGLEPRVMATGGLGGVHRQAAASFDVSTDLDELARADGALVVCSGFKSILDLPATLESLETRGVLVVGYRTDELPGFLSRSSGLALEHRVDSPGEAAALVRAHRGLQISGAIVLAQPVPEAEAVDRDLFEAALESALRDAQLAGLRGKSLTPYLLDSIRRSMGDASLRANCALLVANARLAAEIAVALTVS